MTPRRTNNLDHHGRPQSVTLKDSYVWQVYADISGLAGRTEAWTYRWFNDRQVTARHRWAV